MKSIVTILALAIMASPSFAATTAKKHTKTTNTTAPADTSTNNSAYTSNHSNSPIVWNAGLGLGSAGSVFLFGAVANGSIDVANTEAGDIYVGGKTGFMYGPGSPSSWMIPIMVTSQMNFKGNGKITPYAGLDMGVSIFHANLPAGLTTLLTNAGLSASTTSTNFAMMVKGGLYFGEAQKYYAELPLGTMGSAFAIFPTVGMKF